MCHPGVLVPPTASGFSGDRAAPAPRALGGRTAASLSDQCLVNTGESSGAGMCTGRGAKLKQLTEFYVALLPSREAQDTQAASS